MKNTNCPVKYMEISILAPPIQWVLKLETPCRFITSKDEKNYFRWIIWRWIIWYSKYKRKMVFSCNQWHCCWSIASNTTMKKGIWMNVSRFCGHGSSVLHLDTTFEITNNMWFTDTSFTNESLIDESKNHPEFLGPYMVDFHEDRETYQRFAAELTAAKPSLLKVKNVGADLDSALFFGFPLLMFSKYHIYFIRYRLAIGYNHLFCYTN